MPLHSQMWSSIGGVSVGKETCQRNFPSPFSPYVFWRISISWKRLFWRCRSVDEAVSGAKPCFWPARQSFSALVTFNLFAKEQMMQGLKKRTTIYHCKLAATEKTAGRQEFVRGTLESAGTAVSLLPPQPQEFICSLVWRLLMPHAFAATRIFAGGAALP